LARITRSPTSSAFAQNIVNPEALSITHSGESLVPVSISPSHSGAWKPRASSRRAIGLCSPVSRQTGSLAVPIAYGVPQPLPEVPLIRG
jgi:hypothetical protein